MSRSPGRLTMQSQSYGSSFGSRTASSTAASPLAEASIARDVAEDPEYDIQHAVEGDDEGGNEEDDSPSESSTVRPSGNEPSLGYSMAGSYRRPSFMSAGPRPTVLPSSQLPDSGYLTRREREEVTEEERSLLRDNNMIPSKHARQNPDYSTSVVSRLGRHLSFGGEGRSRGSGPDEEFAAISQDSSADHPSEATTLLGHRQIPYDGEDTAESISKKWNKAVTAGRIQTTWQREAKVLGRYSGPLILTFLLQYSLTVASIFTVGHLGKVELGAVSLASMTANITGYAIYMGLATSLDTLCAQAYGSGRKHLVGLQLQRMVYFLWCITIPIGIIWLSASALLRKIIPEPEIAMLAGRYLKVILLGAPGYAAFESGKRFMQAQGLFSATLYVLLFCAPLNAFMNWLFVWQFQWGFIGAPLAVAITDNLLPICLLLYVRYIDGMDCWSGFNKRAFQNWGPMIRLALPGLLMLEAECLAFEILTLAASYFSTTILAAQSVLATLTSITFQIPFPLSVAASTRIANLIGATLSDAAKTSAKVALVGACIIGVFNVILLSTLRNVIPRLFTSDPDVTNLVAAVLPLCAAFQLFDAVAASCNGILRGLGRQEIGGWVNLFCYYVIAMPLSMGMAFGVHWELFGLWTGVALALGLVAAIEGWFISRASWERSVEEAKQRNALS
ncbi:MAG: hypothetical protein M1827_002365 [Pycnora praestabilis]|nr:MAG: hypothetical protein M1827_002365 [Pycnora praestabilis]